MAERAGTMTAAMTFAVLSMLWLAVRTVRVIACILVTTLAGLVLTTAMGLAAVGRFNLISVAFIPLYVGLGIDFAIQFSVRYRAEHVGHRDARTALNATGSAVGGSLALAAAAMAVGFFAFLPTAYVGCFGAQVSSPASAWRSPSCSASRCCRLFCSLEIRGIRPPRAVSRSWRRLAFTS